MNKFIPLSVPNLSGNEMQYVRQAIETEWVSTAGGFIGDFEKQLAEYVKAEAAVAVQSGTAGLHLALLAGGVGRDDEVIVPTLTFIAAVNPVKYVGAEPVFFDCDDSLCLNMNQVEDFCENNCDFVDGKLINKKTKKHIKAIIVVHIFGNIADMEKVLEISKRYNIFLIEDATEALGSKYIDGPLAGKYAGTMGDIGVYSFNGNKIITTGGGGMIVSNKKDIIKRIKYLSTQAKDDELYYKHDEIGYNYRMTNIQAAIGIAQLEQLETFIETKAKNYQEYHKQGLELLLFRNEIRPNYWFYSYRTDENFRLDAESNVLIINRDNIIHKLQNDGIQTRPVWNLISEQKPYTTCESMDTSRAQI
ncbi:MAG: LegC family aminotransferase, partial [Anaerovoracaceae bacterium]